MKTATIVPSTALQGGRVYVVRQGKLATADVVVGLKSFDRIEIQSGLSAGEAVVVTPIGEMAAELADGTRLLAAAISALGGDGAQDATTIAGRAAKSQSRFEKIYRRAMSDLITVDDLRQVAAKRELYRRLSRAGDDLREVAERVWYSVLKLR